MFLLVLRKRMGREDVEVIKNMSIIIRVCDRIDARLSMQGD